MKAYFTFGIIIMSVSVLLSSLVLGQAFKGVREQSPSYIVCEDNVIFLENVTGLSIQKYAVASLGEDLQFEHVVRVHGTGQEIRFDTREEAESWMLKIAAEAGI